VSAATCGGALLLATLAISVATAGCNSHDCDATTTVVDAGGAGATGRLVQTPGQVIWESSSWDGPWIDYRGNATLQVNLPAGLGPPDSYLMWVSTAQYQSSDSSFTATSTSGQLDEVVSGPPGSIDFNNNSCAEYFARIVLTWYVADAGAPDSAAGADAQAD